MMREGNRQRIRGLTTAAFALLAAAWLAGSILHSSAAADREDRPDAANDPALKIVVFGDSITGHRPGEAYRGKYIKYADLLQLMLEGRYGTGNVTVINSGWAGDTTYPKPAQDFPGAVARLKDDLLDHEPDIAVVLISGNDRKKTDADRQRTAKNLRTIARRIDEAGIRLLMLQYHPAVADPENGRPWDHLDDNNDLIAEAAEAVEAPVLAMGPPIVAATEAYPAAEVLNPTDGVHLNLRGEFVYARAIFDKLDQLKWIRSCREQSSDK